MNATAQCGLAPKYLETDQLVLAAAPVWAKWQTSVNTSVAHSSRIECTDVVAAAAAAAADVHQITAFAYLFVSAENLLRVGEELNASFRVGNVQVRFDARAVRVERVGAAATASPAEVRRHVFDTDLATLMRECADEFGDVWLGGSYSFRIVVSARTQTVHAYLTWQTNTLARDESVYAAFDGVEWPGDDVIADGNLYLSTTMQQNVDVLSLSAQTVYASDVDINAIAENQAETSSATRLRPFWG